MIFCFVFLRRCLVSCKLKFRKSLIVCVDYVNPGHTFPPIGDPDSFLKFAQTHVDGRRPRDWQTSEFHGDRVYAKALTQVLREAPILGPCVTILFKALASNEYCGRLARKNHLHELCIGIPGTDIFEHFSGQGMGDVFEVNFFFSTFEFVVFLSSCSPVLSQDGRILERN